jgi:hypothetical protein
VNDNILHLLRPVSNPIAMPHRFDSSQSEYQENSADEAQFAEPFSVQGNSGIDVSEGWDPMSLFIDPSLFGFTHESPSRPTTSMDDPCQPRDNVETDPHSATRSEIPSIRFEHKKLRPETGFQHSIELANCELYEGVQFEWMNLDLSRPKSSKFTSIGMNNFSPINVMDESHETLASGYATDNDHSQCSIVQNPGPSLDISPFGTIWSHEPDLFTFKSSSVNLTTSTSSPVRKSHHISNANYADTANSFTDAAMSGHFNSELEPTTIEAHADSADTAVSTTVTSGKVKLSQKGEFISFQLESLKEPRCVSSY